MLLILLLIVAVLFVLYEVVPDGKSNQMSGHPEDLEYHWKASDEDFWDQ